MTSATSDRIEKKIILRAPRLRVWRAISNAREFGEWFRVKFESDFAVGAAIRGQITYPGYEHLVMEAIVERVEAESCFALRWHPYAVHPDVDYSDEPMTLVEFRLRTVPEGTELTITESGFDRIPSHRRAEAFRMNDQGWSTQAQNIQNHVTQE